MKKTFRQIAINHLFILILSVPAASYASEPLIPLPGQKQIDNAEQKRKEDKRGKEQKRKTNQNSSGLLIPLPTSIKHRKNPEPAPHKPDMPDDTSKTAPLIMIRPITNNERPADDRTDDQFPEIPDEIVIEPDNIAPPEELPSGNQHNQNYADDPSGNLTDGQEELPVFPKDTSSAVFMVMKTWKADNYDGNALLAHAVEVYSQEAGESFQIKGLSDKKPFKLNIDEEDITLDELLDLISLKTGRDWGVDLMSKTIYFYPERVDTSAYSYW